MINQQKYIGVKEILMEIANETTPVNKNSDVTQRLKIETSNVVRSSLSDWQSAYEEAIDVDNPDREQLLELYEQIDLDCHVSALVETLYAKIYSFGFYICDEQGETLVEQTELFKKKWFSEYLSMALNSFFKGFTGIQFTGIKDGYFLGCKNINRYHILPELKGIRFDNNSRKANILFEDAKIKDWTHFIYPFLPSDEYQLGKYNKLAKMFILKREVTQFWAMYNELFGNPYRVMKTDINDPVRKQNAIDAMSTMTSAGFSVVGMDDELEFHSGSNGAGVQTFSEFLDVCDKAMSKAVLGSTMVLEDGSSRSQSEVHERNTNSFVFMYSEIISQIINDELLDKMRNLGMDIPEGARFKWDDSEMLSKKDFIEVVSKLKQSGFSVPTEYIVEQTGIPVEEDEIILEDNDQIEEEDEEEVQNSSLTKKIQKLYKFKFRK